jgi:methionyl-tRNA formyltransferase
LAALRVVFFGNSNSAFSLRHFEALCATDARLVGVVDSPAQKRGTTNPLSSGSPGFREIALARRIPLLEPISPNDPETIERIASLSPDLFVAVGYTNILREKILGVTRLLAANYHASLLPAYRGLHPVFWCLRNGERWSGLTVHAMDPGIDTGDILYQVRVRVRANDTVEDLYSRIMERSTLLIDRLIRDCERGTISRMPQPLDGAAYYSSIREADYQIRWEMEAETIRRWIMMTPGKCFTGVRSHRLNFLDAETRTWEGGEVPGTILKLGRSKGAVAARRGAIVLRRVQLDGGSPVSCAECLRSLGLKSGDILES